MHAAALLQVGSIEAATEAHPKADIFINFSSFRRCCSMEYHGAVVSEQNQRPHDVPLLHLVCNH